MAFAGDFGLILNPPQNVELTRMLNRALGAY